MKEKVVYNTYYEHFENFKDAVFGFFSLLSNAGMDSELKNSLRRRVSDNFSPIQSNNSFLNFLPSVNVKAKLTMETIKRYNDRTKYSILNCCFEVMQELGFRNVLLIWRRFMRQYRLDHPKKSYR